MADDANLRKLYRKWPEAESVQADTCHCKNKGRMYSFQLPGDDEKEPRPIDGQAWEQCGFWCSLCNFSNAGARPIQDDD